MRILYITEFIPDKNELKFTGGIETALFYLLKYLPKSCQITVLYRPQPHQQLYQATNIHYIPCGPPTSSSAFTISSLIGRTIFFIQTIIQGMRSQYDIVIGTNFTTYLQAFIIGKFRARKTALLYADVLKGEWIKHFGILLGVFGEILESLILLLPWDAYFPISHATAQKLLTQKIPSAKIFPQHLGVEVDSFKPTKSLQKKKHHIITVARLVPYKRIQDLIMALDILRKKHKLPASLEIIGKGPYKKHLQSLATDYHLESVVTFGQDIPQSSLITKLQQSAVFSLPSIVEGFGLVTLESLAAGTPYVNSDIPVTREITQGGRGGLLYKPQDPHDLADKIARLLTDQKLYTEKQKEAKQLIKLYDWQTVATQTHRHYQSILSQP